MIVKLLTEHHLKFLSLTGGCRGPSESTLVKMSNCWKSHAAAQLIMDTKPSQLNTENVPCEQINKTLSVKLSIIFLSTRFNI